MVSVLRVSVSDNKTQLKRQSFSGIPLPQVAIKTADDAIAQWGKLAKREYTSLGDRYENFASNLVTNERNFSFLDALTNPKEQKKFVEHFKEVTGFPDLEQVSRKIVKEFDRVTESIENGLKQFTVFAPDMTPISKFPHEIIFKGYNPNSSVGLRKALPGSDLNDAFLVFKGTGDLGTDNIIRRQYLSLMDEETDARILSFNHEDARPKVMSLNEIVSGLSEMDSVNARLFKDKDQMNSVISQRMGYSLYQPGESPDGSARYNIALARSLAPDQRLFAKDLAIVMEGIRDGILIKRQEPISFAVQDVMNKSPFAWATNLLQVRAIDNGLGWQMPYKTKITQRDKLEHFDSWSTPKQFQCVKNVIKHMTDDSRIDDEYKSMMTNEGCEIADSLRAFKHNLSVGEIFKSGTCKFFEG